MTTEPQVDAIGAALEYCAATKGRVGRIAVAHDQLKELVAKNALAWKLLEDFERAANTMFNAPGDHEYQALDRAIAAYRAAR